MLAVANAQHLPIRNMVADMVYADPPTNRGCNETAQSDRLTLLEYETFTINWLKEAVRTLRPDSWFVICLYHKLRYFFEDMIYKLFPTLVYNHEIIWSYEFGMYTTARFVPSHDNILIYKQGSPIFDWKAVAIPSQRMLVGDSRADWRGRTPGSVWSIPRQPGNSKARKYLQSVWQHSRSSQPEELCERIVLAFTRPQQLVLDLFCGSGTMPIVCRNNQRRCMSMDLCELYIKETKNRMELGTKDIFMAL